MSIELLRALVRPVVTFVLVLAVVVLTFLGRLPPDGVLGMAGLALGWYFSERAMGKKP